MEKCIKEFEKLSLSPIKSNERKLYVESQYSIQKDLLNTSANIQESLSISSFTDKSEVIDDDKYSKLLSVAFERAYPLFYLNKDQRKMLLEKIKFYKFDTKTLLYSFCAESESEKDDLSAFILLEGEIHIFNKKNIFKDLVTDVTFFGYDGPIFKKRITTVIVEKNSVIAKLSKEDFLQILHPFSRFATFISRNIRYKDKVIDHLQSFKNFVLSNIEKGPLNLVKLITLYKKMEPCLHPKCNSEEIDFSAWIYSLNRLPSNVFETFIFILMNKTPRLISVSEELTKKLIPRIKTVARNRDIYKYLSGKDVVIVRGLESDVLDFISNLCIHLIESFKLKNRIYTPGLIEKFFNNRNDFNATISLLEKYSKTEIKPKERDGFFKLFGTSLATKLIHLCMSHQDISISINKCLLIDKDPIERWTQNLWNVSKRILGVSSWMSEIDDLVVDIIQGNKRAFLNCISPHLYIHKNEIIDWAEKNHIKTKTTSFLTEEDKIIAYSYYYYNAFPQKEKEKREQTREYGIEIVENTFDTGLNLIVINVNTLIKKHPKMAKFKPASNNHIIIHLGPTFGSQSHDIIKPVLMLFGNKARSLNIIGKCGGLIGHVSDVMIATMHFLDSTHDVVSLNYNKTEEEELKQWTKSNVYSGPFLTVAGTVIQNNSLLNFYKYVMGCIGLELEGFYYAREVEKCMKHKLITKQFLTRCFYYVTDIPTDPELILTKSQVNISWEEGISSINAIHRFVIENKILRK